jgi:hypothetical protein
MTASGQGRLLKIKRGLPTAFLHSYNGMRGMLRNVHQSVAIAGNNPGRCITNPLYQPQGTMAKKVLRQRRLSRRVLENLATQACTLQKAQRKSPLSSKVEKKVQKERINAPKCKKLPANPIAFHGYLETSAQARLVVEAVASGMRASCIRPAKRDEVASGKIYVFKLPFCPWKDGRIWTKVRDRSSEFQIWRADDPGTKHGHAEIVNDHLTRIYIEEKAVGGDTWGLIAYYDKCFASLPRPTQLNCRSVGHP